MSETTTAEYNTSDDDFDLEKHIEECIQGSYNRLRPIIEKLAKSAEEKPYSTALKHYINVEKLSIELAQFALDYLAIQKGIVPQQRQPKLATQEQLEEVKEILLKLK